MASVEWGESALLAVIADRGWRLNRLADAAAPLPPTELDTALRLAAVPNGWRDRRRHRTDHSARAAPGH